MVVTVTVKGRVQNVGFRMFVLQCAQQVGVGGYVRNTPGGEVYLVAKGAEQQRRQLLDAVRQGPALARVTDVTVIWEGHQGESLPDIFEVRH